MATWIAHLRLAENLLERIPNLNAAQFSLGNIAPDSGVPDEKWQHFDPPKQVTHFLHHSQSEGDIHDLEFYQKYLTNIAPTDVDRFSFRLGYFFHLIADKLWSVYIHKTKEAHVEQIKKDPDFIWVIKSDWYGLDVVYLRDHPDSLFWSTFVQAQPDAFDLDFFSKHALEHQLNYIKTFYQRKDDEIIAMYNRPFVYMSKAEMDLFVSESTETIYKIYLLLWPTPPNLDGKNSVFEVL